jgi:heme/copper-type cytochrome/quinol oxidase subunit 2
MDGRSRIILWTAVIVALVALAVSGRTLVSPGRTPPPAAKAPIDLWMLITGRGGIGGETSSHLFDPQMMLVRRGDTVRLRVMNQSLSSHGIEIVGLGVRTKPLAGGDADEVTFTPDRAGIFEYRCYIPYDPKTGSCSPDHDKMIGHLVVLDAPTR